MLFKNEALNLAAVIVTAIATVITSVIAYERHIDSRVEAKIKKISEEKKDSAKTKDPIKIDKEKDSLLSISEQLKIAQKVIEKTTIVVYSEKSYEGRKKEKIIVDQLEDLGFKTVALHRLRKLKDNLHNLYFEDETLDKIYKKRGEWKKVYYKSDNKLVLKKLKTIFPTVTHHYIQRKDASVQEQKGQLVENQIDVLGL